MDTEALKQAALEATPGPWYASDAFADNGAVSGVDIVSQIGTVLLSEDSGPGSTDAYYIAAANPATVLALITSHEQLVAALKAEHQAADWLMARLIDLDPTFRPTKSPVWEAIVAGSDALAAACNKS